MAETGPICLQGASTVRLLLAEDTVQAGVVFTVDPCTGTVVLLTAKLDHAHEVNVVLVPAHAIRSCEVTAVATSTTIALVENFKLRLDPAAPPTLADNLARRDAVTTLLQSHGLAVTQSADENALLVMGGALVIATPYTAEACASTNSVVLQRIQDLLRSAGFTLT